MPMYSELIITLHGKIMNEMKIKKNRNGRNERNERNERTDTGTTDTNDDDLSKTEHTQTYWKFVEVSRSRPIW